MSSTMRAAALAFENNSPAGCKLDPKRDKLIYTLVKIEGWPYAVHYEFRSEDGQLCIELHIEHRKFSHLGDTFRLCATELQTIQGYPLEYHHRREGRHRKVWPSLSIRLPSEADGNVAASVMRDLIARTRPQIDRALGVC